MGLSTKKYLFGLNSRLKRTQSVTLVSFLDKCKRLLSITKLIFENGIFESSIGQEMI